MTIKKGPVMLHSDVAPDNRVLGRNVQEICLKSSIATSKPEFPCPGHQCNLSNSLKLLANTLYLYGASVVLFVCEYYWYHNMWIQPIQPGCHIHALSTPNFRWLWIWGLSDIVISDIDSAKLSRGGARNFGLGGPSCDVSILFKTNLYTQI